MMSEKTKTKLSQVDVAVSEEAKYHVAESGWKVIKWVAAKLMLPAVIGFGCWLGMYPLQALTCYEYTQGKHFSYDNWEYRYFTCYVHTENGWFTQQEYQASQVGAKIIISRANENTLDKATK